MKKITFLLSTLLMSSASMFAASDVLIIDNFEADYLVDWISVEGSHDLYLVDNPDITGINTSAKVLQGGRDAVANNWAAAMKTVLGIPGGDYNYLHVMMYRDVIGTVPNAKISDTLAQDIAPMDGQTMVTGEWQDVVFDISDYTADYAIEFLYFMYDRGELSADAVIYIDDIVLSNDSAPRTAVSEGEIFEAEAEEEGEQEEVVYGEEYTIDDFEIDYLIDWISCEGAHDLYIVDNPNPTGINTTAQVLQGGRDAVANNWAAAMKTVVGVPGGLYNYLHVMMYRDVIGTVPNAKVSDTLAQDLAPMNETMVAGEWQDVIFDISDYTADYEIEFLYFMYDRGDLTADAIIYIDDIVLNNDPTERTSATGVEAIEAADAATIYAANGTVYVKGADAVVEIYSLTGAVVATSAKAVESATFTLPSGCYIVKAGATVKKVIL